MVKGVWDSITKDHIITFLFIFGLITIVAYVPPQYFDNIPTGQLITSETEGAYGYGCPDGTYFNYKKSNSETITPNGEVWACCSTSKACVTDHNGEIECLISGGIDYNQDGKKEDYCKSSAWENCDDSEQSCTSGLRCSINYRWLQSGEVELGEYSTSGELGCCGDDSNEHIITDTKKTLCCNSPNDIIIDGVCADPDDPIGEICDNGKDDDKDGATDGLDSECNGDEIINIVKIRVSDDSPKPRDDIEVSCTLELEGDISIDDVEECVYVVMDDDEVCDDISDTDDDKITFECDVGRNTGEIEVECRVDDDCNSDRSSKSKSIDVISTSVDECEDLDRDGYCGVLDCNEFNTNVHFENVEVCGDGIDNDCNSLRDENCCSDGILNGDESSKDCGGTYCKSCSSGNDDLPGDESDDWDDDGLSNRQEFLLGSNPYNQDTDGDGILDGEDDDPLISNKGGFPYFLTLLIILVLILLGFGSFFIIKKTNSKKERNINNPRLVEYIRQARRKGMSNQQITQALLQKRWDMQSIQKGLKSVK
jgi:hypothetical protein